MQVVYELPRGSSAPLTTALSAATRAGFDALAAALRSGSIVDVGTPDSPPLRLGLAELRSLSAALAPSGETLRDWLRAAGARPALALSDTGTGSAASGAAASARSSTDERTLGGMTAAQREAWREERRARAAHRDYAALVTDMTRRESAAAAADSFALVGQQFSVAFSVLVSVATAAAVGYYLGRHFIDVNYKAGPWISAFVCAVALLLVEVTLIVLRLSRSDAAQHAREAAARAQC